MGLFLSKNSDDKNLQWLADLASDEDIYGISNRATSSIIFDNINNIGKANCLVKDLG